MCNLLPWRFLSSVTAVVAIAAFMAFLLIYRNDPSVTIFSIISHAVSTTGLIILAFVQLNLWRWFWRRLPFLNRVLFPDIEGTYEGELNSTHAGGTVVSGAKLRIKQTLLRITVVLETADLKSTSSIAQITANDAGIKAFNLFYLYNAVARNNVRTTQPSHTGGAELEIIMGSTIELQGRYFNDPARQTSGEIKFTRTKTSLD